jgi:hypothetical protein
MNSVAKGNAARQSRVLTGVCLVKRQNVMAFTTVEKAGRAISVQDYVCKKTAARLRAVPKVTSVMRKRENVLQLTVQEQEILTDIVAVNLALGGYAILLARNV